jgi:hypothetical protein
MGSLVETVPTAQYRDRAKEIRHIADRVSACATKNALLRSAYYWERLSDADENANDMRLHEPLHHDGYNDLEVTGS